MSLPVELPGREAARAVSFDGERIRLESPRPLAPGVPLRFTVRFPDGDAVLDGRAQASRRRQDGRFDVRLRLVNLRRSERERLREALPC